MKKIKIEIIVDDITGKIGTVWETTGWTRESISDMLELVGLMENMKSLIQDKIKLIGAKSL